MFETSVVRAQAQSAGRRMTLLAVAVVVHSAVIVGAIGASIAAVDFPTTAPDEFANVPILMPIQVPPPLGNPNGGAKPAVTPRVQPKQQPAPQPNQVTAPPQVPDTITPAESASPGTSEATGPASGTVPGPLGVPWGKEGSIGDPDAPPVAENIQPVEEKIYEVTGEVNAPKLIRRVDPVYPPALLRAKIGGTVVVRCIIGKDGRIRAAEIAVAARFEAFNSAAVNAVENWQYLPATRRGEAVDCYLTVTVNFGVK